MLDFDKIRSLIHTFISNTQKQFPRIKGAKYDFNRGRFIGRNGLPIHRDSFYRLRGKGVGREARVGEAAMRRSIFIESLISSDGSERPGLLERFLNGTSKLVLKGDLKGIFSIPKIYEISKGKSTAWRVGKLAQKQQFDCGFWTYKFSSKIHEIS